METSQNTLAPEEIFRAVAAVALNAISEDRQQGEAMLMSWENELAPGYIYGLLETVSRGIAINEEIRQLAAILAKNAIAKFWPVTHTNPLLGNLLREEKVRCRELVLQCLQRESNHGVSAQISLVVANMAGLDFPAEWPFLSQQLLAAALSPLTDTGSVASSRRAAKTLKLVLQSLQRTPQYYQGASEKQSLDSELAMIITQSYTSLNDLLPAWASQEQPGSAEAAEFRLHQGRRAAQQLQVVREAILNLNSLGDVSDVLRDFLQLCYSTVTATAKVVNLTEEDEDISTPNAISSRILERTTECLLAAVSVEPEAVASYIPHFLPLYTDVVLSMDVARMHAMRSKTRVLIVKFLARVLSCHVYKQRIYGWEDRIGWHIAAQEALLKHREDIEQAKAAIDGLLQGEKGRQLIHAVFAKFLAIPDSELQEWLDAPEQYIRNLDVDTAQDTDSPRSCGYALLQSLMLLHEDGIASTLTSYADELRQRTQQSPEMATIIQQEACYAAIGKMFTQSNSYNDQFEDWYARELRFLLQPPQDSSPATLGNRLLTARATILVGSCFSALSLENWREAFTQLVNNLHYQDVVIKLTSVVALSMLLFEILSEVEELQAEDNILTQISSADGDGENNDTLKYMAAEMEKFHERKAACKQRTDHLESLMEGIFGSIELLQHLKEVDSKVDLLKLLTLTIEIVGDRAEPFLNRIASTLPAVWMQAMENSKIGQDTGSVARLHSSLMGLLSHLVRRLTRLGMDHPQIIGVLPFLLRHALNLSHPESEVLLEDGLQLLQIVLKRSDQLLPEYRELLPNVIKILQRGHHYGPALRIIECYLLLGQLESLSEYMPAILAVLEGSIQRVLDYKDTPQGPQFGRIGGLRVITLGHQLMNTSLQELQYKRTQISELREEGLAVAAVVSVLLRLDYSTTALAPVLLKMAGISNSQGGYARLGQNMALISISFQFAEILSRLLYNQPEAVSGLTRNATGKEEAFLDWLLTLLSTRLMPEVLGVATVCVEGRRRRHLGTAAVSRIILANASQALLDPQRLATALALGLRCVAERSHYEKDQLEIAEALHRQNYEAQPKTLLNVSLRLAVSDPISLFDTRGALYAAVQHAMSHCSYEKVVDQLLLVDSRLANQLTELMKGDGGEPSSRAQVQELLQAMDKASL